MNFEELNFDEMENVNGGGVKQAAKAFAGCVLVGVSPAVGVGTSIIGTPIVGVSAGGGCAALGLGLIGSACH